MFMRGTRRARNRSACDALSLFGLRVIGFRAPQGILILHERRCLCVDSPIPLSENMPNDLNRRDALKALISAGSMAMIQPASAAIPDPPLVVRSRPVELTLTPVSANTVRITVQALRDGKPVALEQDGALLDRAWPAPIAQIRSLSHPLTFRAGNLTISVSPNPTRVLIRKSEKEIVQELVLDESTGGLEFNTAGGLLLGLGQGGPQFDRRGHADAMIAGRRAISSAPMAPACRSSS